MVKSKKDGRKVKMPRVDIEARNAAQEKHEQGVKTLNELFGASVPVMASVGWNRQTGGLIPFRRKPGVPNMRLDAVANKKRLKRKRAKLARKVNR
jgi:hypothetical protein